MNNGTLDIKENLNWKGTTTSETEIKQNDICRIRTYAGEAQEISNLTP